jgi:holo-ACP synthase/triphosphoribosyl-dephospho-CoA synthase
MQEITIIEMLEARDRRAQKQKELIEKFKLPVVSFTLNLAGNKKRSQIFDFIFNEALHSIEISLGDSIRCSEVLIERTGNAAFWSVDEDIKSLKLEMISLESKNKISRLYDIDVIGSDGIPISRSDVDLPPRMCLVCNAAPYLECRRDRRHTIEDAVNKINEISIDYISSKLSLIAAFSLECELSTTPKPGLVDRCNSGSHSDMDYSLFKKSILSIIPFLKLEFQSALEIENKIELFKSMKRIGIEAESAMNEATCGINTHRGAFFSLSAVGCAICYSLNGEERVCDEDIKSFVSEFGRWAYSNNRDRTSHGAEARERNFNYGIYNEIINSYPSVFELCKKYHSDFCDKEILNDLHELFVDYYFDEDMFEKHIESTSLKILCTLLSEVNDSNIVYRGGEGDLELIHKRFKKIDESDCSIKDLKRLMKEEDAFFISKHLSPGGTADLLALNLFVMTVKAIAVLK